MQIKEMFEKQIDRDIKGVIKVGQSDEENVYQELDEYVVTKELLKHFRDFFDNYEKGINNNTDKMGVWISGFFGSGKSHFLKILSYLLKNSVVEGKRAIEYFTDGKKIDDPMLIASFPEPTFADPLESILKSMTSEEMVPELVILAISIGSSIFLPSVKYSTALFPSTTLFFNRWERIFKK